VAARAAARAGAAAASGGRGAQATINPFVASFVNYLCTLHLHKVTVTNQTFFSWQGAPPLNGRVWGLANLNLPPALSTRQPACGDRPARVRAVACAPACLCARRHAAAPATCWRGDRPAGYPGAPGSRGGRCVACRGGAALSGGARRLPGRAGEFYTEAEHADAMKATFERWYTTAFQSLQVRGRRQRPASAPPCMSLILLCAVRACARFSTDVHEVVLLMVRPRVRWVRRAP